MAVFTSPEAALPEAALPEVNRFAIIPLNLDMATTFNSLL